MKNQYYKLISKRDDGFLLHRRVAKALTSLHVRMTSPGLSLLTLTKYAS